MNSSIDNSTLNSRKAVDTHGQEPKQVAPVSDDRNPMDDAGPAVSEDRLSLSGKATTQPPESTNINTLNAAHEAVAKLRQLIEGDPSAAVSAQRGLNTDTAATALSRVAA